MKFLTAPEAADLLRIKIDTLYNLMEKDALPGAKVGGQWRFLEDDIIAWFRSRQEIGSTTGQVNLSDVDPMRHVIQRAYRTLVETAFDAFLIVKDGLIYDCSELVENLYGYPREELIGAPLLKLIAPEFHNDSIESWASAKSGTFQRVHRRRDGTVFPVEVSMQVITTKKSRFNIAALRNIARISHNHLQPEIIEVLNANAVTSITPGKKTTSKC